MRLLLTLIIFLQCSRLLAYSVSVSWTSDTFEKKVTLSCEEGKYHCDTLCDDMKSCNFKEKVCRNCIGNTVYLTHIFKEMGRTYQSTGTKLSIYELEDLLKSGQFTTITSKSIYNHVYKFNSLDLRKKFQKLCPEDNFDEYPVVFFKTKPISRELGAVSMVACNSSIYRMSNQPLINFGDNFSDLN